MTQATQERDIPAPSLIDCANALISSPDSQECVENFVRVSQQTALQKYDPVIAQATMVALQSQHTFPQALAFIWFGLLSVPNDGEFEKIIDLASIGFYKTFKARLVKAMDEQNLAHPLFLAGLEKLIIPAIMPERFFTFLRRALWDEEVMGRLDEKDQTALAAAMACYCFHTGYIFSRAEAEEKSVQELHEKITKEDMPSAKEIALYGCYEFLHAHSKAQQIESAYRDDPVIGNAVRELLSKPLQEQEIANDIPHLTEIKDETSQKVRAQYIEFPYPRWNFIDPRIKIENCFLEMRGEELDILIAGCGTGQEIMRYRKIFPHAHILAVDLSPASLSYAIRKTKELGVENVTFKQADILALPDALDKQFDIISSSGVIHHMENPEDGLKALDSLLKPDGLLRLCLYSESGRKHIVTAREVIADKGYGNTAEEMRRFRKDSTTILSHETLSGLTRARDFFILPQLRDLLFHVMEHRYDISQIADMLERHGYAFEEFLMADPVMQKYKERFPDDTHMRALDNWHIFETENPFAFEAMYKFVCRKKAAA